MQAVSNNAAMVMDLVQTGSRGVNNRQNAGGFQSLLENQMGSPSESAKTGPPGKNSTTATEQDTVLAMEAMAATLVAQPTADTAQATVPDITAEIAEEPAVTAAQEQGVYVQQELAPADTDEQDETATAVRQRQNGRAGNNRDASANGESRGTNRAGRTGEGTDITESRNRTGRTDRGGEVTVRTPENRQQRFGSDIRPDRFTRMLERAADDLNALSGRGGRVQTGGIGRTLNREMGAAIIRDSEPAVSSTRQASGAEFSRTLQSRQRAETEPQNNIQVEARPREPIPVNTAQQTTAQQNTPQQPNQPTQAQQVEARIVENIQNPNTPMRTEFEMTLTPQELGRVTVRMALENGRLALEIVTVGGRAEEVLRAQIGALTTALRTTMPDLHTISTVISTQAPQSSTYGGTSPNDFMYSEHENAREPNGNAGKNGRGGEGDDEGSGEELSGQGKRSPNQLLDYSV